MRAPLGQLGGEGHTRCQQVERDPLVCRQLADQRARGAKPSGMLGSVEARHQQEGRQASALRVGLQSDLHARAVAAVQGHVRVLQAAHRAVRVARGERDLDATARPGLDAQR